MPYPSPAHIPLFPPARVRRHVLLRRFGREPVIARHVTVLTGPDGIDRVVDRGRLNAADAAVLVGGA